MKQTWKGASSQGWSLVVPERIVEVQWRLEKVTAFPRARASPQSVIWGWWVKSFPMTSVKFTGKLVGLPQNALEASAGVGGSEIMLLTPSESLVGIQRTPGSHLGGRRWQRGLWESQERGGTSQETRCSPEELQEGFPRDTASGCFACQSPTTGATRKSTAEEENSLPPAVSHTLYWQSLVLGQLAREEPQYGRHGNEGCI